MTDVNKARVLRWIERLERNTDPQGKGYLKSEQGLCCLGVATEEFGDECGISSHVMEKYGFSPDDERIDVTMYEWTGEEGLGKEAGTMPQVVSEYLGIDTDNPFVDFEGERVRVSILNDQYSLSFPEIAALLRKEYGL